jgi:outer membrane protein insertion porin family
VTISRVLQLCLTCVALVMCLAVSKPVSAQFAVDVIEVEGTVRVEDEAVRRRIRFAAGDQISPRLLSQTINAIYDLGFFEDIQVDASETEAGVVLTFIVTEKPSVRELRFVGNERVDNEDILEEITLETGQILDESAVERAARRIGELYRDKGFFLAEVSWALEPAGEGQVAVVFSVEEFSKVQVGTVSIIGNNSLTDQELLRVMQTRPGNILSFLNSLGQFQESYLRDDLQRLRFMYYESGFLDVAVSDAVVELSRDRERVFVTVTIEEGDQYSVSAVGVSGDLLESQEEAMERISIAPGDIFRSSAIREDIEATTQHYQDLGYAYANANLLTDVDEENDLIALTYDLDRGPLTYVGRIMVVGNTSTRDRVLRRELTIEEGDLYSRTSIRLSESYVTQLGFFEEVTIRERPSSLGDDRIDLEIQVVERHTRSLQVGAGFSSAESFLATAQITENNLFGRGQNLSLNMMLSSLRTTFQLSFLEPNLYGSNVALQLDVLNNELDYPAFREIRRGISTRFGYRPFRTHNYWRSLTLSVGYELQNVEARNRRGFSRAGDSGGLTSALTYGAGLDRRNDRVQTLHGYHIRVDNEVADAVFGSENEFYRVTGFARGYQNVPLTCAPSGESGERGGRALQSLCRWARGNVFRANLEMGYIGSLNSQRGVPIFERFYPGGPDSVRGFPLFELGPTEQSASIGDPNVLLGSRPIGGNKNLELQFELEFPILEMVGVRGVLFADAGNAVAINQPYPLMPDLFASRSDERVLRTALGFGFRWRSPLGALRFEWGYPLQRRDGEARSTFQFSIGPSF